MRHVFKIFILILASFLNLPAFAQSFFSNNPAGMQVQAPPPSKVMSPNEFKSQVDTLNKQANNDLRSQAQEQLSKTRPLATAPAGGPTNQPPSDLNAGAKTPPTNPPSPPPQQTVTTATPPPANGGTDEPLDQSLLGNTTVAPPSQQQPPAQSQTYTGFGGSSNTAPKKTVSPSGTGKTGSGWNIKY